MIESIIGLPDNVIAVNCKGRVTRGDYERILIPAVEQALKKHTRVKLYYRAGPEFEGIDPGAILQDISIGFSHLSRWERIAIVTDVDWIRLSVQAFAFLVPGPVRIFTIAEEAEAKDWIGGQIKRTRTPVKA
jgi:hypothetical protein